ncbi:hypothetical protein EON78_03110 [bacterium]|nr:MAG: hypothetical protein EON78_03110 [bacterium]
MDTLTALIVVALICAIILFEINKRERAKVTKFFNGEKISMLIAADKKVKAILNIIHTVPTQYMDDNSRQFLSDQLDLLSENYEQNNITLSEYHAGLDELLGNQFAMPHFKISDGLY